MTIFEHAFPSAIGEKKFASEEAALDWVAGAQGSDQDEQDKADIWKASLAEKASRAPLAGAPHPGFWSRMAAQARQIVFPAAMAAILSFQALAPSLASAAEISAAEPAPVVVEQQVQSSSGEAFGLARAIVGKGAAEDIKLEVALTHALSKYTNLPQVEALTAWRAKSASDSTISSMAISIQGGASCTIAMRENPNGSTAGGGAALQKKLEGIYAGLSQQDQHEYDAIHEMGHCMHYAGNARFASTHLTAAQNQMLDGSVFSWRAPAGSGGVGSTPASLFSENFADSFSALKWMEARDFSPASQAMVKAQLAERIVFRIGKGVDAKHQGTFNPHFTEFAIQGVLRNVDNLKAMQPKQRMDFIAANASDSALAVLSMQGDAGNQAANSLTPEFAAQQAVIGSLMDALQNAKHPGETPTPIPAARRGNAYEAAVDAVQASADAALARMMSQNRLTPASLLKAVNDAAKNQTMPPFLAAYFADTSVAQTAASEFGKLSERGFESQKAIEAILAGMDKVEAQKVAWNADAPTALAEFGGLQAPRAPKIAAYRHAKSSTASTTSPAMQKPASPSGL